MPASTKGSTVNASQRPHGRLLDELRPVVIRRGVSKNSDGSVLIEIGDTKVLCTANIEHGVPHFLRNTGKGWLSAEYGMLPGSTNTRSDREAARGKQSGRTVEIQRLIGRALRQAVNLDRIGERTIRVDCDVLHADGGTRTASITGACVALRDALDRLNPNAFLGWVAAVSVGIVNNERRLDLEYQEDSHADTDFNVVMMQRHGFVEVQGTAEGVPFPQQDLEEMIALASKGISELFALQESATTS